MWTLRSQRPLLGQVVKGVAPQLARHRESQQPVVSKAGRT
jgi:hypothetical protein